MCVFVLCVDLCSESHFFLFIFPFIFSFLLQLFVIGTLGLDESRGVAVSQELLDGSVAVLLVVIFGKVLHGLGGDEIDVLQVQLETADGLDGDVGAIGLVIMS